MKTDNVNFTGFYRIPKSPKALKEITTEIIPAYKRLCFKPVTILDNIPLNKNFDSFVEELAHERNYSRGWLHRLAQINDFKIPDTNSKFINIITGAEDINLFNNFINDSTKKINSKLNIRNQLKILFSHIFQVGEDSDLPLYLRFLKEFANVHTNYLNNFEKFLSDRKVKDVSTPQELLAKMLAEKYI